MQAGGASACRACEGGPTSDAGSAHASRRAKRGISDFLFDQTLYTAGYRDSAIKKGEIHAAHPLIPALRDLHVCAAGLAQDGGNPLSEDDRFALGQIVVTAPRSEGIGIGIDGEALSSEAIYKFNRTSLDDAVNLMPGVVAGNSGGTRNERLVFVRGFDRFQVPLSIDGIRVYLPADNRSTMAAS